jgi:hypothetical protein
VTEEIVFPVAPDTVSVLGSRWEADEPAWAGLDFAKAKLRTQNTLMLSICGADAPYDLHLDVPFWHPGDGEPDPDIEDWAWYRVRPLPEPGRKWRGRKVVDVTIEPAPERSPPWQIRVTFAGRSTPMTGAHAQETES